MAKPSFALRERAAVPGTDGEVQGVIIRRTEQVHGPAMCQLVYLSDKGEPQSEWFSVPELRSGLRFPASESVATRNAKR